MNDSTADESHGQSVPSPFRSRLESERSHRSALPGSLPAASTSAARFPPRSYPRPRIVRARAPSRGTSPEPRFSRQTCTSKPWPASLQHSSWIVVSSILSQRRVNFTQQRVAAHGLVQESRRAGSHNQIAKRSVAVRGDENDGNRAIGLRQPLLQLNAAHPREPDIEDQTGRLLPGGGFEELFRRGEGVGGETCGLQDASQRLTKGFIVVYDGDDAGLCECLGHLISPGPLLGEMSLKRAQTTFSGNRKLSCFRRRSILTSVGWISAFRPCGRGGRGIRLGFSPSRA